MNVRKTISACAVALTVFMGGHVASAATLDTENSIVDYLSSKGEDSSFAHRQQLATNYNIVPYTGSAEQNIKLLGILRGTSVNLPQESTTTNSQVQRTQYLAQTQSQTSYQPQGRTITVTATAYTAQCSGCSGITATGVDLKANPNQKVIAVDPNVIPLGSRVYVEGYGEAIAADTGGAIKGADRIDVFIPDKQEALNWGVRTVKLTILN